MTFKTFLIKSKITESGSRCMSQESMIAVIQESASRHSSGMFDKYTHCFIVYM